jgi:hypothetical protein
MTAKPQPTSLRRLHCRLVLKSLYILLPKVVFVYLSITMLLSLHFVLPFWVSFTATQSISIAPDPRFQSDFHAVDTITISWSGITTAPSGPDAFWQADLWVTTNDGDAYSERI